MQYMGLALQFFSLVPSNGRGSLQRVIYIYIRLRSVPVHFGTYHFGSKKYVFGTGRFRYQDQFGTNTTYVSVVSCNVSYAYISYRHQRNVGLLLLHLVS